MEQTQGFGVSSETQSSNRVSYDVGGMKRATLTAVASEEVGKDTKYKVLSFKFMDIEGIKTFTHSEFVIDSTDENYQKKMQGMNSRIKHIWEAFAKFPSTGVGMGATSFEDFFAKVAAAFNTGGENGTPIFKEKDGKGKLVWLKLAYYGAKGNIGFPLSPNFIEGIGQNNAAIPKTLTINNKYDKVEQPKPGQAPGQMHGGGNTGIHTGTGSADNEF